MDIMPIVIIVLVVLFLVMLIAAIFQWLWNMTIPEVFGLNPLSFWQAFRLLLIALLLFSGGFIKIQLTL
ncbi:MAG TPA: hypothetical protein VJX74_02175 [Blastocatellia bacterium]|nr:hypothetical protein [Blastocatellia bacterium]